uniref:RNA polymerase II elongation factor ELL-like n=1 Tax=Cynoglossus semilaevis TaxID=244447 RepID=A0A3P8V5C1_CYNSE
MSDLRESHCYGLSSGKLSRGGNISVFHVKLTDSAARAIGSFQNSKGCSTHPTICFNGNQGRITVPCSDNREEVRLFTFEVANVARNNPNGSFDCVQQLHNGASEELSCLGVIQKKMTVNATDDSYDKARQSMAQAEEETRSRGAIVIKHGGRYQGKKVTVRAPAPALASLTKPKHQSPQSILRNIQKGLGVSRGKKATCVSSRGSGGPVQERPLRERLTHLLALRPYKRPELILRLKKDGLSAEDKDMLETVVMEVGQLNSRDNTFVLKDSLYKELQKDWPGYTEGDQQLLKRILVRRLFQPQQNLLTAPEAQVSPLRDTPNSSPAHRPKHSLPEEYTDPLANKKPRISHLSRKGDKSSLRTSEAVFHKNAVEEEEEEKEEVAKRLEPSPCALEEAQSLENHRRPDPDRPPSPLIVPVLSKRTAKRKKSKHKHRRQEKERWKNNKSRNDHSAEETNTQMDLSGSADCEPREILFTSGALGANTDAADYLIKYTVICSHEQRQGYKQDFNKEYDEYRDLHARIDGVTRQFLDLDSQLKQLHQESRKYKTVRNQIFQEYRKIKKSNPNYNQDKIRCEYLHNKLAHIKKLISEYDNQQLLDHSCPK